MKSQTGGDHWLYLAFNQADPKTRYTITSQLTETGAAYSTVGSPITANSTVIKDNFHLYDTIRDVTVGGDPTTVDTTVREDVKAGFSTELISHSQGSMTVQARYHPTNEAGMFEDPAMKALMVCFLQKGTIFGVDLDKRYDKVGAQGLAGNWSVGFSKPKPVADLVVIDWNFRLSGKPQWIINLTEGSHNFGALVNPGS